MSYRQLEDKDIPVRWSGKGTMTEETPDGRKDIFQSVKMVHGAGIFKKVAKLRPMAVVKG